LTNRVNHEGLAGADGKLDLLEPMSSSQLNTDHLTTFFTTDPFDTLELRIDKKWVTRA